MRHALVVVDEDALAVAHRLDEEGHGAFRAGSYEMAERLHARSLEHARSADDPTAMVRALVGLARVALHLERWERLSHLTTEAERTARDAGVDSLLRGPLHMRAEAARMRGDADEARRAYRESIALNQQLGDEEMVGIERGNLAWVEIGVGDLSEAQRLLDLCQRATAPGDIYGRAFVLLTKARISLERGDQTGRHLLAMADRTLEGAGLVWDPAEQRCHEATSALVQTMQE